MSKSGKTDPFYTIYQSIMINDINEEDLVKTTQIIDTLETKIPTSHLDSREKANRGACIVDMRNKLISEKSRIENKKRQSLLEFKIESQIESTRSTDNMMSSLLAEHEDEKKQQDKIINELSVGVAKLKDAARSINTEVDEQNKLLKNLEDKVDSTDTYMKRATDGMKKLLKSKDNCTIIIIGILVVILIGLLIFVFA